MKKITVTAYQFEELSERIQDNIISNIVSEILEIDHDNPKVKEAIEEANESSTPWFIHQCIFEKMQDEIFEIAENSIYTQNGHILIEEK